jgi:alkylation response protein AidB-like acyl-CoA dehydrogenase
MTMTLDDAQESLRLIRDSASAMVPRENGPQRARSLRMRQPGFDRALWKDMCRLGWAGLRVPEDRDGSGLGVAALCAVAQQLGASLSPEPFIAVAGAASLLSGAHLRAVLHGDSIVVPAWMEQPHDLDQAGQARFVSGRVTGTKRLVACASAADAFLVQSHDGLALVEREAPGVTITSVRLHDGSFAGDVAFDNAPGEVVPGSLEQMFEESALANAAYLLGAMDSAFEMTLAYLTVRKQFGKPIGSFQALRHRAVDLKIQIELTRAVINEAVAMLDRSTAGQTTQQSLVSRAKARAGDAAMLVARESVQFHGAMGMTDECDIGLYLRKILAVHNDWGSVVAHRQRFAAIEQARED